MKKIRIDGVIGLDVMASTIAEELKGAGDVLLIVNSGGGSILEGYSIFNALKEHDGKITAQIDWAASMASVISMAADEVVMDKHSSLMMIHRPWSVSMGTSSDFRKEADTLDKLEAQLMGIYLSKADGKLDEPKLYELLDEESYLNAEQCLAFGLADSVKEPEQKESKSALLNLAGGVQFDLSKAAAALASSESIKDKISDAKSLKEIESALRDSGHFSKSDATALVSCVRSMARGDHGVSDEASNAIVASLKRHTQNIS